MAKSTMYISLISAIVVLTCQLAVLRHKFFDGFGDSKVNILCLSIIYIYMHQSIKTSPNNTSFKSISDVKEETHITPEPTQEAVSEIRVEENIPIVPEPAMIAEPAQSDQPIQENGSASEENNDEAAVGVTKELKRNNSNSNQSKPKRRHCKRRSGRKQQQQPKLVNNAPTQLEVDTAAVSDMPCLSDDSESTIDSPTLSTMTLPDEEEPHYYSLFSTGFDFGVSPVMISTQEQKFYQPKRRSLLDMLDQDQQAQTTITPTAFSYFDDMMMSTSLYKLPQSRKPWKGGFAR